MYDRIAINYNGWISFGKSSLTPSVDIDDLNDFTSLSSTSTGIPASLRNRIAALNRDMEATSTSQLRVATIGTGTTQTLVVQWSDIKAYGSANAGDLYNFQIRLQQTTNTVSIVYGSFTRSSTTAITTQVGLGSTSNSDYNNRTTTNSWAASTAGTTNISSMPLSATVLPASGLTYTWSVASCLPPTPSSVQFTSTAIPNATISWGAVAGATSYEYAITTSSTPPTSGTITTATTASASGLPTSAIIYAYIRTNCGGGSFSNWTSRAYVPCVINIAPANNATNVAIPTTFDWNTIAGVTTYQILVSSDNGVTYPLSAISATHPISLGGLAFSTSYKFYVRGISGSDSSAISCATTNATSFTTQALPPPPANDDCTGAIALTPGTTVNGTTISATQSIAPSLCTGYTSISAYDVWYSVTALSNGTFTVSVSSTTGFDAVLGIYRGTCASLILDTCRDATVTNGTESITYINAVAGTQYFIRVYRYNNSVDNVGTFIINVTGPALPVTGVTLSGARTGSKAQLNWQTLTEINNAGFELQRSADSRNFTGIINIASKANGGNSTAAITYTAEDTKPFSGANYYRLKQTDKDGKISYSNIIYLKGIAVNNLTLSAVYPNPTNDVLKAAIQSPAAENITFVITDMMGKTISRQVSSVVSGDNTVSINVANMPSGSYLLKAICRNGCETAYQKFTKQ